jgi:KUP system potassium uptake protein
MRSESEGSPHAMLHNLSRNKVLYERVIVLTVEVIEEPWVAETERIAVAPLGHNCYQVNAKYGFKDEPNIPKAPALCIKQGLNIEMMETSFFIARQTVISGPKHKIVSWHHQLFVTMSRNVRNAADDFRIPTNSVIELETQVEI